MVYTDFEKAFDRVDHVILLAKLEKLGIHGCLLRWIKSYLSNRSQIVTIGGYRSNRIYVPSGVPQGSHLGPLFYNAYIFDIYTCIKTPVQHLLYADDKKVFLKIRNISDCRLLQNSLNCLVEYYKRNKITVNASKCQVITFSRKTSPIYASYIMNNIKLQRVQLIRDLGVLLDSKMLMSDHIDNIINKAYKNLGFVMRVCKAFNDPGCIKTVYFTYVRSVLEYASNIWSPHYITYKSRLERLQQRFLKYLNYRTKCPSASYKSSCERHNVMSLEDRRVLLDMGFLYDIVTSYVDCPNLVSEIKYFTPKTNTRYPRLLSLPQRQTNFGRNSVMYRIMKTYNNQFNDIDPFVYNSKKSFKSAIANKMLRV